MMTHLGKILRKSDGARIWDPVGGGGGGDVWILDSSERSNIAACTHEDISGMILYMYMFTDRDTHMCIYIGVALLFLLEFRTYRCTRLDYAKQI